MDGQRHVVYLIDCYIIQWYSATTYSNTVIALMSVKTINIAQLNLKCNNKSSYSYMVMQVYVYIYIYIYTYIYIYRSHWISMSLQTMNCWKLNTWSFAAQSILTIFIISFSYSIQCCHSLCFLFQVDLLK